MPPFRQRIEEDFDSCQVTVSGESAGAIMTAILFLGHQVERFARAAVGIFYYHINGLNN